MKNAKIKVAIVDDHQIVIDGIKALLDGHEHINIVLTNTNATELLAALHHTAIDVLLTDMMMPVMNGLQLAREVKKQFPEVKIMALSMSGQGNLVSELINDADIAGYVLKNIGKEELTHAIEKIAAGGIYFSEEVLADLEKFSMVKKENEDTNLTAREIEIIKLIEKEYSNKDIANTLYISERTVETHRKNIFRKTKTSSVIGLIKYAYEHQLI